MGKAYARRYRKELKDQGISSSWFAMLENVVVASGKTKSQAEKRALEVIPKFKRDYLYIFKI